MTQRTLKALQTLKNIFKRRGYADFGEPTEFTYKTICMTVIQNGSGVHCLFVPFSFFKQRSAAGKAEITEYAKKLSASDRLIIVSDYISFKTCETLDAAPYKWEHLTYVDAQYDPFQHYLVPVYRRLAPEEVKRVEARFGPRTSFPRMVAGKDRVARMMAFEVGDVLEVTKRSAISGESVGYKYVIDKDTLS